MILAFDETQTSIRDAARSVCSPKSPDASRAGAEVWQQFAQMGWTGVVLSEGVGGSEGSLIDAGLIALEMGRGGLFHGFADTVALSLALAEHGPAGDARIAALLGKISAGNTALAFALRLDDNDPLGAVQPGTPAQGLVSEPVADETLVLTLLDGPEAVLVAIDLQQTASRKVQATMHGKDWLIDLGAAASQGTVLLRGAAATRAWARALSAYRLLACTQLVGAARQFLDLADEYSRVRSQFGRVIGSFQAVQHALVETLAATDGAELLAFKALRAADHGAAFEEPLINAAIAFTRESVWTALMKSYDVLGGVGYMEDHPLSRYTRKLFPVLASLGCAEQCEENAGAGVRKGAYLS